MAARQSISCDICGSDQFNSEGGFYYCLICNTQSQQTREYAADEGEQVRLAAQSTRAAVLAGKAENKKSSGKEKVLFTTWETSNKILKTMTEKLINIGFPALLREKVFQLWKTYLLRRGILVRQSYENDKTYTSGFLVTAEETKWNLRALFNWQLKSKRKKKSRIRLTTGTNASISRRATKSKSKAFESTYLESQNQNDLEGIVPEQGQRNANSKVTPTFTPSVKKLFKILLPRHRLCITRPSHLSVLGGRVTKSFFRHERLGLQGILIILFIACRQIGCRVVFSDFIRLTIDGTLSVKSAPGIDPTSEDNLEIDASYDTITKGLLQNMNPVKLCREIQIYLDYLGVKRFLCPKFEEFLPKFTHDSSLPLEFELFVLQMHRMFSDIEDTQDLRQEKVFPGLNFLIEIRITALITLLLRFLFGLDDHTEKHQSRFASKVNEILSKAMKTGKPDPRSNWSELFDIKEWFRHIRYRSTFVQQEGMTPMSFLFGKPPNLTRAHDFSLRYAVHDEVAQPTNGGVDTFDVSYNQTTMLNEFFLDRGQQNVPTPPTTMKGIFRSAAVQANQGQIPEVADYISMPYPHQTIVQEFQRSIPNCSYAKFDSSLLYETFRQKRIDYIYHPEKYIPLLEKAGYKVKVLPGTAPLYQKELKLRRQRLILFQPYKRIDESIKTQRSTPSSMQFVLDYMSKYVYCNDRHTGFLHNHNADKAVVSNLVENLSRLYAMTSRDAFIPLG